MKKTDEKYLRQRKVEVVENVRRILDKSIGIVDGSLNLSRLVNEVSEDQFDEDFMLFIEIASDSDHLPLSHTRQKFSKETLKKADDEIREIEKHYRERLQEACTKLVHRFSSAI